MTDLIYGNLCPKCLEVECACTTIRVGRSLTWKKCFHCATPFNLLRVTFVDENRVDREEACCTHCVILVDEQYFNLVLLEEITKPDPKEWTPRDPGPSGTR